MTAIQEMKAKFAAYFAGESRDFIEMEWRGYIDWLALQPPEVQDEHIERFNLSNRQRLNIEGK